MEFFEVRAEPHLMANQRRDALGRYTVGSFVGSYLSRADMESASLIRAARKTP